MGELSSVLQILQSINQTLGQLNKTLGNLTMTAGGDLTGTYPNPTIAKIDGTAITGATGTGKVVLLSSGTGATATIATAKLTGGGTNGSMTFTNGVLTAQIPAT